MRGMTLQEYTYVVEFVQKFHRFGWVRDEDCIRRDGEQFSLLIKYVDNCYDSRDETVWMVRFRGPNLVFTTNHFSGFQPPPPSFQFDSLFSWVMAYLSGEWYDEAILAQCSRRSEDKENTQESAKLHSLFEQSKPVIVVSPNDHSNMDVLTALAARENMQLLLIDNERKQDDIKGIIDAAKLKSNGLIAPLQIEPAKIEPVFISGQESRRARRARERANRKGR